MLKLEFFIDFPGPKAIGNGLLPNHVAIEIEHFSGQPVDQENLENFWREAIVALYDGARVLTKAEYDQEINLLAEGRFVHGIFVPAERGEHGSQEHSKHETGRD